MYFRNYGRPKTWLDKYKKKHRLRVPLEKPHVKQAQTLLKSERWKGYHIY